YNLLIGEDAAIVTDIPGTTRDVLQHSIPLGRVMLRVADTAGIRERENMDTVERIGIEKSREMIAKSELLFALFDISREFDDEDQAIIDEISHSNSPKIALLNKSDLAARFDKEKLHGFDEIIEISAKENETEAIEKLSATVNRLFTDERLTIGQDAVISSARQHAALARAIDFMSLAIESLSLGFSQDAASSDIERALGAISELDGRSVSEEIVSDIFSKFCVGK
ncbi:MAG: 50S ribosome-binding GTPase, partial [Clostridia bacterium]|nr:50S ribosome-binding GTPase [Clostridia bacterium]